MSLIILSPNVLRVSGALVHVATDLLRGQIITTNGSPTVIAKRTILLLNYAISATIF